MLLAGKNINLRTVEVTDAEFIYLMRINEDKTRYLSKITGTIKTQEDWIKLYKQKEKDYSEFYFVIESKNSDKLGLVRVYDFKDNSFCWGSWLIKSDAPKSTAIESALQIYEFGFNSLNFEKSHFDVRKENIKVVSFHKRCGAKIVDEDEQDYFFSYDKKNYEIMKAKYSRYL